MVKKKRFIIIMADQDHDGSHIKGLILNLIHSEWPELLEMNYVNCMVTPIIKATNGTKVKSFYTLTKYSQWKEKSMVGKWNIKYYKGLGTSTAKEAKEYFRNLKVNQYITEGETTETMELAFKKTEADKRKEWLKQYKEEEILDYDCSETRIDDFVNKELIHLDQISLIYHMFLFHRMVLMLLEN